MWLHDHQKHKTMEVRLPPVRICLKEKKFRQFHSLVCNLKQRKKETTPAVCMNKSEEKGAKIDHWHYAMREGQKCQLQNNTPNHEDKLQLRQWECAVIWAIPDSTADSPSPMHTSVWSRTTAFHWEGKRRGVCVWGEEGGDHFLIIRVKVEDTAQSSGPQAVRL